MVKVEKFTCRLPSCQKSTQAAQAGFYRPIACCSCHPLPTRAGHHRFFLRLIFYAPEQLCFDFSKTGFRLGLKWAEISVRNKSRAQKTGRRSPAGVNRGVLFSRNLDKCIRFFFFGRRYPFCVDDRLMRIFFEFKMSCVSHTNIKLILRFNSRIF